MPRDCALVSHCEKKMTENTMRKTGNFRGPSEKIDAKCLSLIIVSFAQFDYLLFTTVIIPKYFTIRFVFSKAENNPKQTDILAARRRQGLKKHTSHFRKLIS